MTNYEPIIASGEIVVLDKAVFEKMREVCEEAQMFASARKALNNYERTGKKLDGHKVLDKLREKHVRKV